MPNRNRVLVNLIGLWIFGILVGANARDLLPGEPSLPSWAMLAIGLVGSFGVFAALYKATR